MPRARWVLSARRRGGLPRAPPGAERAERAERPAAAAGLAEARRAESAEGKPAGWRLGGSCKKCGCGSKPSRTYEQIESSPLLQGWTIHASELVSRSGCASPTYTLIPVVCHRLQTQLCFKVCQR